MPKRRRTPDRPRDLNQLAHRIVAISTGEATDDAPEPPKDSAVKGGEARAQKLPRSRRVAIARKAAKKRWKRRGGGSS